MIHVVQETRKQKEKRYRKMKKRDIIEMFLNLQEYADGLRRLSNKADNIPNQFTSCGWPDLPSNHGRSPLPPTN